jgi:hypothetical protein
MLHMRLSSLANANQPFDFAFSPRLDQPADDVMRYKANVITTSNGKR